MVMSRLEIGLSRAHCSTMATPVCMYHSPVQWEASLLPTVYATQEMVMTFQIISGNVFQHAMVCSVHTRMLRAHRRSWPQL
jgi:hypothetical protein